jgi:anaerobic selenocysteine-containing dehydrogenase
MGVFVRLRNRRKESMDRRDFLKGAAGASLAMGLAALLPGRQASARGMQPAGVAARFRGSSDGRIYESADNGATWQLRADFGVQCAITEVFERGGQVYARIKVQGHPFVVQSWDGRKWYAMRQVPPRA